MPLATVSPVSEAVRFQYPGRSSLRSSFKARSLERNRNSGAVGRAIWRDLSSPLPHDRTPDLVVARGGTQLEQRHAMVFRTTDPETRVRDGSPLLARVTLAQEDQVAARQPVPSVEEKKAPPARTEQIPEPKYFLPQLVGAQYTLTRANYTH